VKQGFKWGGPNKGEARGAHGGAAGKRGDLRKNHAPGKKTQKKKNMEKEEKVRGVAVEIGSPTGGRSVVETCDEKIASCANQAKRRGTGPRVKWGPKDEAGEKNAKREGGGKNENRHLFFKTDGETGQRASEYNVPGTEKPRRKKLKIIGSKVDKSLRKERGPSTGKEGKAVPFRGGKRQKQGRRLGEFLDARKKKRKSKIRPKQCGKNKSSEGAGETKIGPVGSE